MTGTRWGPSLSGTPLRPRPTARSATPTRSSSAADDRPTRPPTRRSGPAPFGAPRHRAGPLRVDRFGWGPLLHRAVVAALVARAAPRRCQAGQLDHPDHPVAVPAVGL